MNVIFEAIFQKISYLWDGSEKYDRKYSKNSDNF